MDIQLATRAIALPAPRFAITIRAGELRDVPFLDSLQKMHTKQVGFMPTRALEGKIKLGHVLVAEESGPLRQAQDRRGGEGASGREAIPSPGRLVTLPAVSLLNPSPPRRQLGYLIGNDQYFKRDDLGIIYQMNVLPGKQRGLIGASLLKAQFERSAYGCKLYCCWCAQDIDANRFWEACGFVPLAFRTGSRTKGKKGTPRVHIFWQKRIREGDTTTPWWFPSQTSSGAIREDRLVLPIPHGVKWSDAMPVVLPGEVRDQKSACPELTEREVRKIARPKAPSTAAIQPAHSNQLMGSGFVSFAPPRAKATKREKAPRTKEPETKQKNDPRYIAAARELRDRWLEQVNADPMMIASDGKYDVARALHAPESRGFMPLLEAA